MNNIQQVIENFKFELDNNYKNSYFLICKEYVFNITTYYDIVMLEYKYCFYIRKYFDPSTYTNIVNQQSYLQDNVIDIVKYLYKYNLNKYRKSKLNKILN